MINKVANEVGDEPDLWPGRLVDEIVLGGYRSRADTNKLTGDWIIYGKYEEKNYYIDLATHNEGHPENVELLFKKLRGSAEAEFPFLFA